MGHASGIWSATHYLGIKKKLLYLFSGKGWIVGRINHQRANHANRYGKH
jgi:hypothetical protein